MTVDDDDGDAAAADDDEDGGGIKPLFLQKNPGTWVGNRTNTYLHKEPMFKRTLGDAY